jgi:hypothetical protein
VFVGVDNVGVHSCVDGEIVDGFVDVDGVGSRSRVDGEVVDAVASRSLGSRSRVAGEVVDDVASRLRVDGEVVGGGDVGSCSRSRVDGEVVDDDDVSSRSRVDVRIAHGGNARADDAGAVGMGRGSGARPRRLPIHILRCVVFERS